MEDDRIETAYHEGGHLVAAALINLLPRSASIEPEPGSRGRVARIREYGLYASDSMSMAKIDPDDGHIILEKQIWDAAVRDANTNAFLCVAGGVAAQLYLDSVDGARLRSSTGNEDDEWYALEGLDVVDIYDNALDRLDDIQAWTECFFSDKAVWGAIEHTAQELLKQGTLDEEATEILHIEVGRMLEVAGKECLPSFSLLQQRNPVPGF